MPLTYGQPVPLGQREEEEPPKAVSYGEPVPLTPRLDANTAVDPAGFPIDLTRPRIPGRDRETGAAVPGMWATEESETLQLDQGGRWFNIPRIVNGQRVDSQTAARHAREQREEGRLYPHFESLEEAERQAPLRSEAIGRARAGSRKKYTYGEPVPMGDERDLAAEEPGRGILGWLFNAPSSEEQEALREYYEPEAVRRRGTQMTSTAPGGGFLGLPSPEEAMPATIKELRRRMDAQVQASYEGYEEDSWWEIVRKNVANAPRRFRAQIAGGLRAGQPLTVEKLRANAREETRWGEVYSSEPRDSRANMEIAEAYGFSPESLEEGVHPVDALVEHLGTPEGQAQAEDDAKNSTVALIAEDFWDAERQALRENMPKVRPQSAKYYAAGIIEATINMGPAIGVALVTKNPNAAALIMGGQVYGETYGDMIDRGYAPEAASQAALFMAAAETLTERIPIGILTRNQFRGWKRIAAAAGAEGIQEPITEALQMGYDIGILNESMTMGEALQRLVDAAIIGFGAGASIGSVVSMGDNMTTPAGREMVEEENELDRIAGDIDRRARLTEEGLEIQDEMLPLEAAVKELPQSPSEVEELVDEGLVRVDDAGNVKVLPKGRRKYQAQRKKIREHKIIEEAAERGAPVEHAKETAEVATAQGRVEAAYQVTKPDEQITQSQKEDGNYRKGRFPWQGMEVAIETPRGAVRSGVTREGETWTQTMRSGYGYFVSKPGADQEAGRPTEGVDVYIGEDVNYPMAYIVNQRTEEGDFDEHKVMVGYRSQAEAEKAYRQDYAPARGQAVDIVPVAPDQLRAWLDKPTHTQPVMFQVSGPKAYPLAPRRQWYGEADYKARGGRMERVTPEAFLAAATPLVIDETARENIDELKDHIRAGRVLDPLTLYPGERARDSDGRHRAIAAQELGIATVPMVNFRDEALGRQWADDDVLPSFHVEDATRPTSERYPLRGKRPIGAPPKVKTLEDVDDHIDELMMIFEDSKLIPPEAWTWFEDSGAAIRDITQNDIGKMHDTVKVLAVLSQATGVTGNVGAFVKAAYEIAKGNTSPMVGRFPNMMSKSIKAVLETEEPGTDIPRIGNKLVAFYRNLYDATFNTNKWPESVTIDRWMARISGYRSDEVSGTQYTYAEKVMGDAMSRFNARNGTNWLPRHGQAALWNHERSRVSMEKHGKLTPVDSFSDALEKVTAQVTHEAVPSLSSDVGQQIAALPYRQRGEFTEASMSVIYENEKNLLLEALGIPLYTGTFGSGGYEGLITPNQITGVTLLKEGGNYDRPTADAVAQAMMYIYQQDAGMWFRMDRNAKTSQKKISQGITFDFADELSPEVEGVFYTALTGLMGPSAAYTRTRPDRIVVLDPKSADGVAFSGLKPAAFLAKMQDLVDMYGAELGLHSASSFGAEVGYLTHDWVEDPDGEALTETLKDYATARGRRALLQRVRRWRQSAQEIARAHAARRPRPRIAASVPVDRLDRGASLQAEVYGRYGDLEEDRDTTNELKFYDLTPVVEDPEMVNKLVEDLGFQVEVFSFEPGNFRIPKLGRQNYDEGYVWIYDPAAAHGSFKDTEYTRAWRVTHEAGHGLTEQFVQERYGDSKRYGRLGRSMMGERGAPPKRVEVELDPLTLQQAQRAVEWEDVAFRAQRILLRELGIRADDATFNREFNTNISDAVYRITTGDFGDPGEYGFMPSASPVDMRSVLESLEATEQTLAEQQGRAPTEGINLAKWKRVSDAEIESAVELKLGRDLARVDMALNVAQEVPRNPGLPVEVQEIEQRMAEVVVDLDAAEAAYNELEESEGGVVLSTDTARELSEDYRNNRALSSAVQSPASWFIHNLYAKRLSRPTPPGKRPVVLFTAGGTGAGKTTGIRRLLGPLLEEAEIVRDTNLQVPAKAIRQIEQALEAGRSVNVTYTWRDPVVAMEAGTLPRAMRMGRTVAIDVHMATHIESYAAIRELADHFADNPAVTITLIDNSGGVEDVAVLGSVEDIPATNLDYNTLEGLLHGVLNRQLEAGAISQSVHDATATPSERPGSQGLVQATRRRNREEPEAESAQPRPDKLASLQRLSDEFAAHYPNSPHITVVETRQDLPPRIRVRIADEAPRGVAGMFIASREGAEIYLISENLRSARHALDVMLHEAVGHYGLRSILGAEYDSTMDRIVRSMPRDVSRAARRNGIPLNSTANRRLAAEEVVAYRAEAVLKGGKMPRGNWFTDIIDSVKIAIARLRGIKMTDVEILRLIRKARVFTAAPMGLAYGAQRNMSPPVLYTQAWIAMNDGRVPMSASVPAYARELNAQVHAGNLSPEANIKVREWLDVQVGEVDKVALLKELADVGNEEAMFSVEYDGRRDAVLNGDHTDDGFNIEEGSQTNQIWNYLVFKAQDKFIDLLNVEKAIEQQTGAPLPDNLDAYLQEELFHGRIKHRVDEYEKKVIRPLVKAIETSDYTWDEVEWYLYARHAPEANAHLYKINRATPAMRAIRDKAILRAIEKLKGRRARIKATRERQVAKLRQARDQKLAVARSERNSQKARAKGKPKRLQQVEEAYQRKVQRAESHLKARKDAIDAALLARLGEFEDNQRTEIGDARQRYREAEARRVAEDPGVAALSGMSNAEAKAINEIMAEKGDARQLRAIAKLVDAMTAENRRVVVEEGLETQETVDAWEATYENYVPLKGFRDGPGNTTFFKKGRGYDTGGAITKRRLGRRTKAANILANIVAQHQASMVLAEKAKVGRTLLEMATEHPNPELWEVNKIERKKFLDKRTGLVVTGHDPTYALRDNVIRVKVEGQDYHITFNENYAPGLRIARAMKNLSGQDLNFMFRSLLGLNRILSAVNTSYNPEFIISNLIRDLQTAAINLNATEAANVKRKVMGDVFKAHRGIRRYLELPSFKNQEQADFWRTEFEEYRRMGGQVGWLQNYKDVQSLEQALYRQMNQRDAGMVSWNTITKMGRYIEAENQAVENAVRLSAYHHAKAFMSPERAASLAKNLTVNFNRKGDIGTALNALYLFYNASIQGMSIMWKASKSKKARHVMYGIIAFAAAMDIINRMIAGDDDDGENRYDKIPHFVRERNLIMMLPDRWQPEDPENFDDYFLTLPLPYGYNMLYAIGEKIGAGVDYVGIGNKRELDPMQGAFEIVSTALGSFNPIGAGPTPLQSIVPTVLQPLTQISENTAWHGGPVFPPADPYDPAPEPESQRYFRSVPEHTKALAEFLNRLGGGTDVRPAMASWMDISPETIQLWEDFLTGGAGRFVTNLVELGVMAKEGDIDVRRVPMLRRLVSKTDERAVSDRFYLHREEIGYAQAEMDAAGEVRARARTPDEIAAAQNRLDAVRETYAVELGLVDVFKSTNQRIRDLNVQRRSMEQESPYSDEVIEERVESIEQNKSKEMNRFNRMYNERLREMLTRRAEERFFPLIQADTREEVVTNFREAGMTAMADLIETLPNQAPPSARQELEEAAVR